jgi:hypothetical protein
VEVCRATLCGCRGLPIFRDAAAEIAFVVLFSDGKSRGLVFKGPTIVLLSNDCGCPSAVYSPDDSVQVSVPVIEEHWQNELESLRLEYKDVVNQIALEELKAVLQQSAEKPSPSVPRDPNPGEFREKPRRWRMLKLNPSDAEEARSAKKLVSPPTAERATPAAHPALTTRILFPLRHWRWAPQRVTGQVQSRPPHQQQEATPNGDR